MDKTRCDYSILADPQIFAVNKMEPVSAHKYEYGSDTDEKLRIDLNGSWKFQFAMNYDSCEKDFWKNGTDVSTWDDIEVPGHVELQGYDVPRYVNIMYPWDGYEDLKPGEIPTEYNPVYNYVLYTDVPENYVGRAYISFQGVESALHCG